MKNNVEEIKFMEKNCWSKNNLLEISNSKNIGSKKILVKKSTGFFIKTTDKELRTFFASSFNVQYFSHFQ